MVLTTRPDKVTPARRLRQGRGHSHLDVCLRTDTCCYKQHLNTLGLPWWQFYLPVVWGSNQCNFPLNLIFLKEEELASETNGDAQGTVSRRPWSLIWEPGPHHTRWEWTLDFENTTQNSKHQRFRRKCQTKGIEILKSQILLKKQELSKETYVVTRQQAAELWWKVRYIFYYVFTER